MKLTLSLSGSLIATLVALSTFAESSTLTAASRMQVETEGEVQVLTRGPVHEAFAETISFDPEPGIIVATQPPEPIEEVAPDLRPEGENVAWIPGYLAWDDEREDFLWVSGIWRDLPPGRQWMPGYWAEVDSGFQWISGYWADAALTEIQYLPAPPASVEEGPNIAAPSDNDNWLPGCWIWQQNRYAWQPGYWAPMQADWDWVPAHYVSSPRGYVFVNGYYDHSVSQRGVLFAPVYLNSGVYGRQGYSYSPSTVINLDWFSAHLFSRPQYHHYYFGDYYANSYSTGGYYPSFSYASSGYGYDPFYARQRWINREDRDWQRGIERDFADRRDHEDQRPAHTFAAMKERTRIAPESSDKSLAAAMSLEQLTQNRESRQRFKAVDKEERQLLVQRREEMQKFRTERRRLETDTVSNRTTQTEPVNVKLPQSPVVARNEDSPGKAKSLPKNPDAPKVDPKVVAKPRVPREPKRNRKNDEGLNNRPGTDTRPPTMGKDARPGSKSGPPDSPESKAGKSDRRTKGPGVGPKPGDTVAPKSDRSKEDPRPKGGKGDQKPDMPKTDPKPKEGKVDAKPVAPKDEPKRDQPKSDSQPRKDGPPKADQPKGVPKQPGGNTDPKPNVPKTDPKPDPPKADPPKAPKVNPPKP